MRKAMGIKRFLAVFLAAVMILSVLPGQALAKTEKEEEKVSVKGEAYVGEELEVDLKKLDEKDVEEIVWQEKDAKEKDSKAENVKKKRLDEEKKVLELQEEDLGKVFRIVVKMADVKETKYVSDWTDEVKTEEEKKATETKQPETEKKAVETKQSETEKKAAETKQSETEKKATETKQSETEKKATETKQPETEKKATEAKQPETEKKSTEAKQSETEKRVTETKQPETEKKAPEPKQTEIENKAGEPQETEGKSEQDQQTGTKGTETDTKPEGTPAEETKTTPKEGDDPQTAVLQADKTILEFAEAEEGYKETPEAQTVTITNTGATAVTLTQPTALSFEVGILSKTELAAGENVSFTIRPKLGLEKNVYDEDIAVTADSGEKLTVKAKFTVKEKKQEVPAPTPVYTIAASKTSLDFGSKVAGYSAPKAQVVEITNTGNTAVKLLQPTAADFTVSAVADAELAPGAGTSLTIKPKEGLKKGTYEETIQVRTEQNTSVSLKVKYVVTGNKIIRIVKPEPVVKANGQDKTAKALGLPKKVRIQTTDGVKRADVAWRVKAADYSKYTTEKQVFRVDGKITLPKGIENLDKISLKTSIRVTVKAYVPKKADPASNTIKNIEAGKTYNANTDYTFQAAGAGMDNTKPKKGDDRYCPASWSISNTSYFGSADYKGTFKLTTAGDYTLKVTFNHQIYDGKNWTGDGTADTRTISFKIAASTGTDTSTGKTAAKTADTSPIMPMAVTFLLSLAGVTAIMIFERRKQRKAS